MSRQIKTYIFLAIVVWAWIIGGMNNTSHLHRPPAIILTPGQRGTTSGLHATVVRHYDGNMYEIRVPGGVCCIDARDFIPTKAA